MKGQLRSPSAAWRPDSPASTRKGPGRGQSQELVVVQLEIRAANGGTQKPGIVPVGETEVQPRFAGDRHPDSFVEGGQIERFDGPQRMAHRADAGGIHLGQALQQVNPAHGVPQHLVHAEGLRMPLLEVRHGFQEVAGVLPQEATRAKDHQAAASQLQADLLLLGAVDPRHQVDGEAAGGMQDDHSRPPVPSRPRRRSQQVALHPNTGLGVVPNQLPHQTPVQLFLLKDLHLERRPVGRHGAQKPHPVPPDPPTLGLPLGPGADGCSTRTDQQGRQIGSPRRQPGGRPLHLIQPWYLPGPGAAGFRCPGQPGQDRRGRRHKPPARNPAGRPARCLSSIHCRTFLPPNSNNRCPPPWRGFPHRLDCQLRPCLGDSLGARASRPHKAWQSDAIFPTSINQEQIRSRSIV